MYQADEDYFIYASCMTGRSPENSGKLKRAALLSLPALAIAGGEVLLQAAVMLPHFTAAWGDLRSLYHQTGTLPLTGPLVGEYLGRITPVALWGVGGVFGTAVGGITAELAYGNIIGVIPNLPESNKTSDPVGFLRDVNRDAWRMMRRWNGW